MLTIKIYSSYKREKEYILFFWGETIYAASVNRHQYSLFIGAFAAFVGNPFFITRFSANVFFIQLDYTAKCRNDQISWVHHLTDGMAHFPGAFLRGTNLFGQNNRGYAFGWTDHIIDDQQPLP